MRQWHSHVGALVNDDELRLLSLSDPTKMVAKKERYKSIRTEKTVSQQIKDFSKVLED